MCACQSKCTYWMGATAPQRCELFVNYFAVYLTGRSSVKNAGGGIVYDKLTIQFFFLKTAKDTRSLKISSVVSRAYTPTTPQHNT